MGCNLDTRRQKLAYIQDIIENKLEGNNITLQTPEGSDWGTSSEQDDITSKVHIKQTLVATLSELTCF